MNITRCKIDHKKLRATITEKIFETRIPISNAMIASEAGTCTETVRRVLVGYDCSVITFMRIAEALKKFDIEIDLHDYITLY